MTTLEEHGGWRTILGTLTQGQDLTSEQAAAALGAILAGEATPAQIAGFIIALRMKGEAVDEVSGMVDAMLAAAAPITLPDDLDAIGRAHGVDMPRHFASEFDRLRPLLAAGAAEFDGASLHLPPAGRLVARAVVGVFDRHLQREPGRPGRPGPGRP